MTIRIVILTSILFSFYFSIVNSKNRSTSQKAITTYLGLTVISETIAWMMAWFYNNNMPVFHIFNPILLLALGYYFTSISTTIRSMKIGHIACTVAIAFSVINTVMLQPLSSFNSNYLLLHGLCIVIWGLISLYDFQLGTNPPYLYKNPDFWICVVLIAQQVAIYFLYILLEFIEIRHLAPSNINAVYTALWMIGVLAYLSFGLIFIAFPAKSKKVN